VAAGQLGTFHRRGLGPSPPGGVDSTEDWLTAAVAAAVALRTATTPHLPKRPLSLSPARASDPSNGHFDRVPPTYESVEDGNAFSTSLSLSLKFCVDIFFSVEDSDRWVFQSALSLTGRKKEI